MSNYKELLSSLSEEDQKKFLKFQIETIISSLGNKCEPIETLQDWIKKHCKTNEKPKKNSQNVKKSQNKASNVNKTNNNNHFTSKKNKSKTTVENVSSMPDEILMPRRLLEIELRCPICLEIIRKAVCVKECLHRFCNSCLDESLRKNGKVCPICRTEILTRRHTRLDSVFDQFVLALNFSKTKTQKN